MSELAAKVLRNLLEDGRPLEECLGISLIKNSLSSVEVQEVIDNLPKPTEPKKVFKIKHSKTRHINLRITERLYNEILKYGSISETIRSILIEKFKAGEKDG